MMMKFFSLTVLIITTTLSGFEWYSETRISGAPAWYSFFSYTTFTIPSDTMFRPNAEGIKTRFILMPYFEGMSRLFVGKHINIRVSIGGAFFHHGTSWITEYMTAKITPQDIESIAFVSPAQLATHLFVVDTNIGSQWCLGSSVLSANPLFGYVYNQQNLTFVFADNNDKIKYNTLWTGPYAGIEGAFYPNTFLTFRGLYKFVFGHVRSCIVALLPIAPLPFSNACLSQYRAPMFGNLLSIEFLYQIRRHIQFGVNVAYWQYQNHKEKKLKILSEPVPDVQNALINRFMWRQVMLNFFVGCSF